ncbi:MAG: hypothetical protein LBH42_01250 [Treponema sp.]|nr:hypothetical protein [Treponema sp.]
MYTSIHEIPGISEKEIKADEALKEKYNSVVYGMFLSTEAFIKGNGEVGGYAALFCDWLTGIFDIKFKLEIFNSSELLEKIGSGEIDFSGNMMPIEERLNMFYISDTIAERQLTIVQLQGSRNLDQISLERPLRYAFIANTPLEATVASVT